VERRYMCCLRWFCQVQCR